MRVGPNTVVSMDYSLRLDSGEVIDSSEGGEPLSFEFGREQIVPGLERGMVGMGEGEQREIRVEAEEGYGPHRTEAIQELPLDHFPDGITPELGMRLSVRGPQGEEIPFVITGLTDTHATLDFNHPLAGEVLTFSVTVRDVRVAGGGRIILPGEA